MSADPVDRADLTEGAGHPPAEGGGRPDPGSEVGRERPRRPGGRGGGASASGSRTGKHAGIVSRGVAAGCDLVMVLVLCGVLVLGSALVDVVLDPRSLSWPLRLPWEISAVAFLVIAGVYLAFCWGTGGRTVGGALMGTRVVAGGARPGWITVVLRAAACVVFPIGLLWVVLDPQRRSLQDRLLGTSVLYDEPSAVRPDPR